MSADAEQISQSESDALARESREARDLDERLAGELRRGLAGG
jgi:hypothetical protein